MSNCFPIVNPVGESGAGKLPITSQYGPRAAPVPGASTFHNGIDLGGETGIRINAAAAGQVITAGWDSGGGGNIVVIQHPGQHYTAYMHLNTIGVQVGQQVNAGQQIGTLGSTGYATGPHLHFEMRGPGYTAFDPAPCYANAALVWGEDIEPVPVPVPGEVATTEPGIQPISPYYSGSQSFLKSNGLKLAGVGLGILALVSIFVIVNENENGPRRYSSSKREP